MLTSKPLSSISSTTIRSTLSRHASSCTGVSVVQHCPHEECTYVATSSNQLARHRRSHGERVKHHECNICSFKSNQASHMKRHMLCHQGIKPYSCPHCSFTCGSLENLRKHVLRSGRHPGLFLYYCRLCPYNTNTATELREHLTTAHSHKFNAKSAIQAVKLHLMINADTKQE